MATEPRKTLADRNKLTARTAALRIQEELDLGDTMFWIRLDRVAHVVSGFLLSQ